MKHRDEGGSQKRDESKRGKEMRKMMGKKRGERDEGSRRRKGWA